MKDHKQKTDTHDATYCTVEYTNKDNKELIFYTVPQLHISLLCSCTLQRKSHLCIPFLGLRGLSPSFHIHVSVSDLYIPRIGPHICCSIKGRSIVGIYKLLTDTRMWKLGLTPLNSFSGNICFKFSVLCLCSVVSRVILAKGTVSRDFSFLVFSWLCFTKPLKITFGSFQSFSNIRRDPLVLLIPVANNGKVSDYVLTP